MLNLQIFAVASSQVLFYYLAYADYRKIAYKVKKCLLDNLQIIFYSGQKYNVVFLTAFFTKI